MVDVNFVCVLCGHWIHESQPVFRDRGSLCLDCAVKALPNSPIRDAVVIPVLEPSAPGTRVLAGALEFPPSTKD